MKTKFLVISCGFIVFATACGSGSETKTETDTAKPMAPDTTAKVAPAPPPAPAIDSAAIAKEYLAAQSKGKKKTPPKPVKQDTNYVTIYTEVAIPSHEALEQPAAGPTRETHTKEYVYYIPAQTASFVGGDAALAAFLKKNIVYPENALRYHVEGTVYADIYLDSVGTVKKVEFNSTHLGNGLEEETEAVLMRSPRWHPAKENGKMVASKLTLPVVYKITH